MTEMAIADHLATFGRDRCNWLAADTWQTETRAPRQDDLCPGPRDWYVEVNHDGTTLTHLCDDHKAIVEQDPGFVSALRTRAPVAWPVNHEKC